MFIKYQHCFAQGWGEPEYAKFPDKYTIGDIKERLSRKYEDSEHYRCTKVIKIDIPPRKFIEDEIEICEAAIKRYTEDYFKYKNMLIAPYPIYSQLPSSV